MKKLIFFLVLLANTIVCNAAPLSPAEALARIGASARRAPAVSGVMRAPSVVMTGTDEDGAAAFYVFSNGAGTMFVSADDMAVPLLGYSDSGDFDADRMPPQLRWWLDQYARQIALARRRCGNDSAVGRAAMKIPADADDERAPIAPLVKTVWSQEAPFNKYCPYKNGEPTVSGCVATAMAQVMNYFQWPQTQVEPISYEWEEQTLTSPAVTLNWAQMLRHYFGDYAPVQGDAVGRLMQLAGYSVQMDYGTAAEGGSGAQSFKVRNAWVNNFGYDVATDYRFRDFYTTQEWEDALYNNLAEIGPVYYDGRNDEGGHAFVCDGYDTGGYFHFNWGWAGYQDGYYLLTALNPGDSGIGGTDGGYNFDQGMVVGAGLPRAGSTAPKPFIGCDSNLEGYCEGTELYMGTNSEDGGFWNFGYQETKFQFGVRLVNTQTDETFDIYGFEAALEQFYGFTYMSMELGTEIPDGNYRAYPLYRLDGDDWQLVKFYNGKRNYLNLVCLEGAMYADYENAYVSLGNFATTTGFVSGGACRFSIEAENSYQRNVNYPATAVLVTFDEDDEVVTAADFGTAWALIPAEGESLLQFEGILPELAPGEYFIVVTSYSDIPDGVYDVQVTADSGIRSLETAADAPVEYYNLQGLRISDDKLRPGIYIIRRKSGVSKVQIR